MFDTRILGCKQRKDQIDWQTVHRVEIQRFFKAQENTNDTIQTMQARMRQGNAMPDTRRPEAFTLLQRIDRLGRIQPVG